MSSFKEYRKNKKQIQSMETCFGSHSINEDEYEVKTDKEHDALHKKLKLDKSVVHPPHLSTVNKYSNSSWELNDYLHKKYNNTSADNGRFKEEANRLTSVLSTQKTKLPVDLYTGIKYSPAKHFEEDESIPESKMIHLPAFTSTSTKRSIAGRFSKPAVHNDDSRHGVNSEYGAKHIIRIHAPEGTSASSIKEFSFMPHEEEVLLNRGHNIMLDSKPEHIGDDVYQWNARIVSHTPSKL